MDTHKKNPIRMKNGVKAQVAKYQAKMLGVSCEMWVPRAVRIAAQEVKDGVFRWPQA